MSHAYIGFGNNHEYLQPTAQHLVKLGISDFELPWLSARVQAMS